MHQPWLPPLWCRPQSHDPRPKVQTSTPQTKFRWKDEACQVSPSELSYILYLNMILCIYIYTQYKYIYIYSSHAQPTLKEEHLSLCPEIWIARLEAWQSGRQELGDREDIHAADIYGPRCLGNTDASDAWWLTSIFSKMVAPSLVTVTSWWFSTRGSQKKMYQHCISYNNLKVHVWSWCCNILQYVVSSCHHI